MTEKFLNILFELIDEANILFSEDMLLWAISYVPKSSPSLIYKYTTL